MKLRNIIGTAMLLTAVTTAAALPIVAYVADRTGLPILPDCVCTTDSDCARKCGGFGDTDEDVSIFRRMSVAAHGRLLKADRMDSEIMRLRSQASARGASPAEIQRNVLALETDRPADCLGHPWIAFSVGNCNRCDEAHHLLYGLCHECRD